jgi:large subunit ribosomal protein L17
MKHLKKGRKFHRKQGPRKALKKSLGESLILHGKIKTTEAKAKELRPFIEKYITTAKKGDIAAFRSLRQSFSVEVSKKLIKDIAPALKERNGGYTRIIKTGQREQDAAKMAIIEIIK